MLHYALPSNRPSVRPSVRSFVRAVCARNSKKDDQIKFEFGLLTARAYVTFFALTVRV